MHNNCQKFSNYFDLTTFIYLNLFEFITLLEKIEHLVTAAQSNLENFKSRFEIGPNPIDFDEP